jgi:hypothetical protein
MRSFDIDPNELPPPPTDPHEGIHLKPKRKLQQEGEGLFPRVHIKTGFLFPRVVGDLEEIPFGELMHVEEQDADALLGDDGLPRVVETIKYKYEGAMVKNLKNNVIGEWWQRIQKQPPEGKT